MAMLEITEEDIAKRYLERKKVYRVFGIDLDKIHGLILEEAGPFSGRILEIGTGKGYMTLKIAQAADFLTSVDIEPEQLDYTRLFLGYYGVAEKVDLRVADSHNLPFPDASFDLVISVNTIHHLINPFATVNECRRVLAPGGKILFSDFSEQGFFIVNKVHQSEGRTHDSGEISLKEVKDYIVSKNIDHEWKDIVTHSILKIYG